MVVVVVMMMMMMMIIIIMMMIMAACSLTSLAESVVGVHVRHGDKKTESAIIPIEQYLEAAKVSTAAAARRFTAV